MQLAAPLVEFIVDLEVSSDVTNHLLRYPDGRDHVSVRAIKLVLKELLERFELVTIDGEKWIFEDRSWLTPDTNPYKLGDHVRNTPHLHIERVPFVPWLDHLTPQENRTREIVALLEYRGLRNVPNNIGEIKELIGINLRRGEIMPANIYVLIDHISSPTNQGDHFEGPTGELKVYEDRNTSQANKMRIMREEGRQAFALEKAKRGVLPKLRIVGRIGLEAYQLGIKRTIF